MDKEERPTPPDGTKCSNFNCRRAQNLWAHDWDGTTRWFCWPHYRMVKKRWPPYKGRAKHHEYAISIMGRQDYPSEERARHREFAKKYL